MGSGAVGGYLGALLHMAKEEVYLIGRGEFITALKERGMIYQTADLEKKLDIPCADGILEAQQASLIKNKPISYALITTKAHHTKQAALELASIITSETTLISIQNGLGTEKIIRKIFPNNVVLRGITSIGVSKTVNGYVKLLGRGETLVGYNSPKEQLLAKQFVNLLSSKICPVRIESNILGAVFSKVIVNCSLNPLTAIYRVRNAAIVEQSEIRKQAIQIAREAWAVAKAKNITLTVKNPIKYMLTVSKATGNNRNSMLLDVLSKRKTEIDFLNGKIIQLADEEGISVPKNKEIYQKVLSLEQKYLDS